MQNNQNNLISIDDLISRAKRLGIDFGRGNPRERLRYLTKIGLLPQAKRKSFNNKSPQGAYPEWTIELLMEIDKEIKAGKSIQAIKKEKERKGLIEFPHPLTSPPELAQARAEVSPVEKELEIKKASFEKITSILKITFLALISGGIISFLIVQAIKEDFYSYLLASPQEPSQEPNQEPRESFPPLNPEPYLTINVENLTVNAETDINAPLNVKEEITTPALTLVKDDFRATLTSADLTAEQTYIFPDLSGIVCLTAGNCIGIGGEVFSPGGVPNRLAKFLTDREIGISSIKDLFLGGVALTIDPLGNVGIGTAQPAAKLDVAGGLITEGNVGIGIEEPAYSLHVEGRIQATGDICTDLGGGRCLSQLLVAPPFPPVIGIRGAGTTNYLPIWTDATTLGDSLIYQRDTTIGIGTPAVPATLTLSGNAIFGTTVLPQLTLKYDDDNYLNFAISGDQSLIEASKRLVINSLTGEVKLGDDVGIFDASGARVKGNTFISAPTDSTVRKSGELVFRANIPIFRFPMAAETTSTSYVTVSRVFLPIDSLDLITPPQLPGTDRVYAFLINFADNIVAPASSNWRVYRPNAATTTFAFEFPGQNLPSLEVGRSFLTATTTLPDNDWQLEVKSPSPDKSIRIFNIFLLVFDKIK